VRKENKLNKPDRTTGLTAKQAKHALRDDSEHGWSWDDDAYKPLTADERRKLREIRARG